MGLKRETQTEFQFFPSEEMYVAQKKLYDSRIARIEFNCLYI
jgi:hypothetical protein